MVTLPKQEWYAPCLIVYCYIASSVSAGARGDGFIDLLVADGAHAAQLLGQDQVGFRGGKRFLVQLVQRGAAVHRSRDARVDLARVDVAHGLSAEQQARGRYQLGEGVIGKVSVVNLSSFLGLIKWVGSRHARGSTAGGK